MKFLKRVYKQSRRGREALPSNFNHDKKELIDYVFRRCDPPPMSFADLGGVWNVDGAYTFYTLDKHKPRRAILVDNEFTRSTHQKSRVRGNLDIVEGNFGEDAIAAQVDGVDAILLFDILVHQAKPRWDEVLEKYAGRARYFIVYNPQWTGSADSVRLLDLGREGYFENTPHSEEHPTYKDLFDKLDEPHPLHRRPWRDVYSIWQWGITDRDLVDKMQKLGFTLEFYKNCGRYGSLPHFENHAFVFRKNDEVVHKPSMFVAERFDAA